MAQVEQPIFRIFYNGKNITTDLTENLLSVRYTDKVIGESDDIEIKVEDTAGRWVDGWYPSKGDRLKLQMGHKGTVLDCGEFEVDEIALDGPPDVVTLKGIAAWVTSPMRTKDSKAHENKTLKEIAQYVATKNGLTLDDGSSILRTTTSVNLKSEAKTLVSLSAQLKKLNTTSLILSGKQTIISSITKISELSGKSTKKGFPNIGHSLNFANSVFQRFYNKNNALSAVEVKEFNDTVLKLDVIASAMQNADRTTTTNTVTKSKLYTIRIARSTQDQEADLAYLKRLADQFGFAFSIRGSKLVFVSIYELEDGLPVRSIDRSEMKSYSIKDKTSETYNSAVVKYQNPKTKQVVSHEVKTVANSANVANAPVVKKDVLYIKSKAENRQQAEAMATAALHSKNSLQQTLSFSTKGDPLMVAGNNIEVTGFGTLSGRYHIMQSTHTDEKGSGYTTDCECKRVGYVQKVKQKPKKTRKPKPIVYEVIK